MNIEKSCGAVVFTRDGREIRYVIIRSTKGVYGFPKGHVENLETEKETAMREINEEIGLSSVSFFDGFRVVDEYPLTREGEETVLRQIVYFLAEYRNQPLRMRASELSEIRLLSFDEAMASLTFKSTGHILREANLYLKKKFVEKNTIV